MGRSTIVGGRLAGAEVQSGAGLSWFDLSPMPATPVPYAEIPRQGEVMAGVPFDSNLKPIAGEARAGVPLNSNLEPIATACSPIEQPAVALSPPTAFSEDAHWDHLLGVLALVAYVPYLQRPSTKEEPRRSRQGTI